MSNGNAVQLAVQIDAADLQIGLETGNYERKKQDPRCSVGLLLYGSHQKARLR